MQTTRKEVHIKRLLQVKATTDRFFKLLIPGLLLLIASVITLAANSQKQEGKYFNNLNKDGVILDGYDAVAFFTDNKPVKGDAAFQYSYQDAIYYFATAAHLDMFKAEPAKYKPQ